VAAGCAATTSTSGNRLIRDGDHVDAVAVLRHEEAAQPDNPRIKRNLGVSLLELGDAEGAVAKLAEARRLDAVDPLTLYFLGRAAEAEGDVPLALGAYSAYLEREPAGSAVVRARMGRLSAGAEREGSSDPSGSTATPEQAQAFHEAMIRRAAPIPYEPSDRLFQTGTWLGMGPGPARDRRGEEDPALTPAAKIDGGSVLVHGDLPPGKRP
jgi:Flp pilus assembly protein TadD